MQGAWHVNAGRVVLAKRPGVDALGGTIIVAGQGDLLWNAGNQINDAARIQLLSSDKGGSSLNLNGFSDTIDRLTLAAGTKVFTDGSQGGGVLTVRELWVDGERLPRGVYTSSVGWLRGSGYVVAGDVKVCGRFRRGGRPEQGGRRRQYRPAQGRRHVQAAGRRLRGQRGDRRISLDARGRRRRAALQRPDSGKGFGANRGRRRSPAL